MIAIRLLVCAVLLSAGARSAMADEAAPYLDDRSSAERLVESFYNAISRKEYARAWDYFGDAKPAKDFATFVKGFARTARVAALTGPVAADGAAGSTYFEVPVAIAAVDADGGSAIYAGCYTARLTSPQNQAEPPFRPLQLEKGKLAPAEGPLASALPAQCGDGPAPAAGDAALQKAKAIFRASYAGTCQTLAPDASPSDAEPDIYAIKFHYESEQEEREVRLFRFGCGAGAYNSEEIYFAAEDTGEVRQLHFPEPELDIRYSSESHEKLESMTVVGFTETDQIANSEYDEQAQTITSFAKWRGAGDTSASGTYLFRNGRFTLVKYEVDPTEDGEINPQSVLDYDTPP